ncbi:MAG: DUF945 family protein [Candidatus Marithrix sp.]
MLGIRKISNLTIRLLFTLIILTLVIIIPYFSGIVIEQQFTKITQKFYQSDNVQLLKSDYQRGWFNSNSNSIIQVDKQVLTLKYNIKHGFLPIIKTKIHTIVATDNQKLLDISTKIKINGDNISVINSYELEIQNYKWQGLQGNIHANRQFTDIKIILNSSQLNSKQIKIEDIVLQLDINDGIANGSLEISSILGQKLQLETIKFFGKGQIQNSNLMLTVQNTIKKVNSYGASSSNIELSNLYLPSLLKGILTYYNKGVTFNWLMHGMNLLNYLPKLAITNFKLNTSDGLVYGELQMQLKPLKNPLLALFNPNPVLDILELQLLAYLPKSLQQNKSWIRKELLIEDGLDHYKSNINLHNGLLQVNGQHLPLTVVLSQLLLYKN